MTVGEQIYNKGLVEGETKGMAKGLHVTVEAIKLIQAGLSDRTIAKQLTLDVEDVQRLREQIIH